MKCSPTVAWLGRGVFWGAEGIRGEPCALLLVAGGFPLASPVGRRVWRGAACRGAGDERSKCPAGRSGIDGGCSGTAAASLPYKAAQPLGLVGLGDHLKGKINTRNRLC